MPGDWWRAATRSSAAADSKYPCLSMRGSLRTCSARSDHLNGYMKDRDDFLAGTRILEAERFRFRWYRFAHSYRVMRLFKIGFINPPVNSRP